MARRLAVLSRSGAISAVQQYGPVVFSIAAAAGLSLLLHGYLYPRPLFLLALVLSIWGRGLGPGLVGAGLATVIVRFLFPELVPAYGIVSDTTVFGLAAVAISAFSSSKLRAEARRKRVEDQLRTSERRLALAQSAAHLGVWDRDLRTKEIVISGEYAKLYGLPPDQRSLTNEEWLKLIHPDDRERVQELIRETLERTHVWDTEFRVVWADESIHWLLAKGTVFLDEAGQPVRTTGVSLDITERKRAEAALRESEERFRNMADAAPVMIWISGLDKLCTFFNKGWLDFTGRTVGQELGNGWATAVHPDDLDRCFGTYSSSFDARRCFRMEYRLRRADGEYRWVLDNSVPLYRGGEFSGYISSGIDVTEQKLAQDRLRASQRRLIESEERLTSAQRLAHVGNWVWDIKADCVFWSEELCRIFGRPQNYAPDYQAFLQAVQPQDRERVESSVRDSLAGKKSPDLLEFQIARPDGEVRTVACISEVLSDAAGSPVRMSGACQDVTDQRRAEAASRRSRDEIAHLNRVAAMGELATSLAHELNQPLAAILSNAQAASRFLSSESPDLLEARACMTDIIADDKRAGEVIRSLRRLLKKEAFQASLVYLDEVVNDALRLVGNDALLRQASVKFEPLPGLPPVLGDRIQLYQVVLNLIVNGLAAVAERPPGDRWVLVRTAEADGGVALTVEDSGKGIAQGDLAGVFEPFFSTKREGLGMGLSISRSIVQVHGGRIWAENSERGGAIIRCVLPVGQQTAATAG